MSKQRTGTGKELDNIRQCFEERNNVVSKYYLLYRRRIVCQKRIHIRYINEEKLKKGKKMETFRTLCYHMTDNQVSVKEEEIWKTNTAYTKPLVVL